MTNLVKNYIEIQTNDVKHIKNFTCQLLVDYLDYKAYGSGVFIKIKNSHFLISAAHVFDNSENLMIAIDNGKHLFKPGGNSIVNNPILNRNNDKIDIGILKLDEESVAELSSTYKFLEEDNLLINHSFSNYPFYSFFGYPASKSKFSVSKQSFHVTPFFHFTSPAEESVYAQLKIDGNQNVITSYDKKRSYNIGAKSFSNGPDLYGISGCGLWFTDPVNVINKATNPKLVAIMTDWPTKNKKYVVGTRIDVITEAIKANFDIAFPTSKLVSMKN